MAEKMTGAELATFIDSLRELLDDGDLRALGAITLRGQRCDLEQAARGMLRRVDYYRAMSPKEREALGPKTMRHELAGDLALLREALDVGGLLWRGGSGDRLAISPKPPRLRPRRRR